ncbi:MAG TPA: argininosuccinate synthase [Nitrososphaeraceae archaeon]|nr:argininosuccinate synthase [Nitrososphaeraceae archaeon]
MAKQKVVLAYSGGLDTSVCIKYLQVLHDMDVVTVTVDCGQTDDFTEIEKKARSIGAIDHIKIDAKEEFATKFVIASIKANGLYQDKYPLGTALARPLMASKIVEIAHQKAATIVAHGCTGKGNDQVRFDLSIRANDPDLKIIAPIRDMNLTRDLEIQFAKDQKIPVSEEAKKYSIDQNIWGRSIEGGNLENAFCEPPVDAFSFVDLTNDRIGQIELEFQNGIPVAVDGKRMRMVDLIEHLTRVVGSFGVGIIDHIEDRTVGIKSREVYEAPAAVAIIESHKDLEKMVLTNQELRFKAYVDNYWSWLVYSGLWYDPLRRDLDKFIDETQKRVNGKVKLRMHNGSLRVTGRESEYSLYKNNASSYDTPSFDQSLAKGFIELWGLQTVMANVIATRLDSKTTG